MPFNRYETAGELINSAAAEMGITPVSDPYSSEDGSFIQLVQLAKSSGRELLNPRHIWSHLLKRHTFQVSYGDSGVYAVPEDFERLMPDTFWDNTDFERIAGPLSPQGWQWLISGLTIPVDPSIRFRGDRIEVFPILTAGVGSYATYSYEYLSRGWVQDGSNPLIFHDAPTQSADVVMYHSPMFIKMLKWKFLAAKGFDTTAAATEFGLAYDQAVSTDSPGRTLSLVSRGLRFLDPGDLTSRIGQ